MSSERWPVCRLFGIPIHALRMDEVLDVVNDRVARRERLLIGVVNAAKMVNMWRDPELGRAVLSADLTLADGQAVVWGCRLLGRKLPERVAGIDLMHRMLDNGAARGHRVYCLGAEADVLDKAVERMREMHPGVTIAGHHHGYFTTADEPALVEEIRAARADILLVAMTSPKKERFLAQWADELDIPVCHGVGGAFDVVAGKVKRAPRLWQRLGLEWLYRVCQEPGRMWKRYLVTNTMFLWMLLRERLWGIPDLERVLEASHADPAKSRCEAGA